MKIAFVVGFYDSVRKALNEPYPEQVYRDRLILIDNGKRSLTIFKERFYDVVRTAEGLLVCLGRAGTERYLEDAVEGIIGVARSECNTPIQFKAFGNLYDPAPVLELVNSFGLETGQPSICVNHVRSKIADGKILCVSLEGKTPITTALQRAGFAVDTIQECFDEEVRKAGRNSNLMQQLQSRAQAYTFLLYAWDGLRTTTPDVKSAFKYGCAEASSASQVVEVFKKLLKEGV